MVIEFGVSASLIGRTFKPPIDFCNTISFYQLLLRFDRYGECLKPHNDLRGFKIWISTMTWIYLEDDDYGKDIG